MARLAPPEHTWGQRPNRWLGSFGPPCRRVTERTSSRDDGEGTARMSEQIDRPDGHSSQPRVLLVEDDQGNRRRIREILANEGIDVVGEASDGQAGIDLTARLEPDVVLMDLRMPRMGGLEATR